MSDRADIFFEVAKGHTTGKISTDEMGAILGVMGGAPIIRETTKNALNARDIFICQDAQGNPLVAGKNYKFREETVKVLREEFGAGNFLDTYYRVWYLNTKLEERFAVTNASYPKGVMEGAAYRTRFEPTS